VKPSLTFKPRSIANIPVFVQVICGPLITGATLRLHELWPPEGSPVFVLPHSKIPVRLTFGSGLLEPDLDLWFRHAIANPAVAYVIVAGDDSVVSYRGEFFCADASSYDQTQSFGPLETEYRFLEHLGMTPNYIDIMRKCTAAPLRFRPSKPDGDERCFINRDQRPMRDTGGPDTTLGNSLLMGLAWVFVLNHSTTDVEGDFLRLGFKMKLRICDIATANFLKGHWMLTQTGYCWVPSIARILKFGKCLNDPRQTFKKKDLHECVVLHARCMSSQYISYREVPLFKDWIEMYPPIKDFVVPDDLVSHHVSTLRLIREDPNVPLISQLSARFHISEQELLELASQLHLGPFHLLEHPAWVALAVEEYHK
jgi:hypothetical protein